MYGCGVMQHSDMFTTITHYEKTESIPKLIPRSVTDTCDTCRITAYKIMPGKLLSVVDEAIPYYSALLL